MAARSLPHPNTLLIDSEQLVAGDALDDNFRRMAADEIERYAGRLCQEGRKRIRQDDQPMSDQAGGVLNRHEH